MEKRIIYQRKVLFLVCLVLQYLIYTVDSQSFIGTVFSGFVSKSPGYDDVAKFLNATYIKKLRINLNAENIPFADIDVSLMVDVMDNSGIPLLEFDWTDIIKSLNKYNLTKQVHTFLIGDKVFEFGKQKEIDNLVPAMNKLQKIINQAGLGGKIKVSTLVSTEVLTNSYIPSLAAFKPEYYPVLIPMLHFLKRNRSPLLISTFPYLDYVANATSENLNFCLFEPSSGRFDSLTRKHYTNMFAVKVDSMRNALDGMQFQDIEIVVAETGWPCSGDDNEIGANLETARLYNANLIQYLRSNVGTPLMPKKSVDTYIYSLFDTIPLSGVPNYMNSLVPNFMGWCGIVDPDLTWRYNLYLNKGQRNCRSC